MVDFFWNCDLFLVWWSYLTPLYYFKWPTSNVWGSFLVTAGSSPGDVVRSFPSQTGNSLSQARGMNKWHVTTKPSHLPLKLDVFFVLKTVLLISEREASYGIFSKHWRKMGEKRQGSSFDGHYIILYYIVLYYIILEYIISWNPKQPFTVIILYYIILYYIILYCIILYYIRIYYIILEYIISWNPKQPFLNGCFSWMIPNLYIENGCFTKHPFINGCLGFQDITNPNDTRENGASLKNDIFKLI